MSRGNMSKLSDAVKALIDAPHARPGYTRASAQVQPAVAAFAQDAAARSVGLPAWITISTAVSATMNCPEAMTSIFQHATSPSSPFSSHSSSPSPSPLYTASLIREVGLKCISFNGIPRSINTLSAFRSSLPPTISSSLASATNPVPFSSPEFKGTRELSRENLEKRQRDGRLLWDSVYRGFETKLLDKLALSHPDLPVVILEGHYGVLLSDPSPSSSSSPSPSSSSSSAGKEAQEIQQAKVGRVLTSLVAISCLRAQTGVGPQVTSHVFGLRKAYEFPAADEGGAEMDEESGAGKVEGGEWLASNEGVEWMLRRIDGLVEVISGGEGTSFAPGIKGKL